MWTWVSIIGFSMTPNLVFGPSVALGIGYHEHINPFLLIAVVTFAGWCEGMVVALLATETTKLGFIHRWLERTRSPKVIDKMQRWGVWLSLMLIPAAVGQEPVLVALPYVGVDLKRTALPLAVSNLVYAIIYYWVVKVGLDQMGSL